MITNRNDKLQKAFVLEPGEQWLVAPRFLDEKKYILAPTVKMGVKPGSHTFRTELFAPLLAVVPVRDLEEAIRLVNALPYGLTSGLQSLDEREQRLWRDSIQAGNLYINRGITGAIVNRQPFGGMKLSAFGGGLKAGGPNYCVPLVRLADRPGAIADWRSDYEKAYEEEFARPRDRSRLHGEQNLFRYLPLRSMALRLLPGDRLEDVARVIHAARLTGTPLTISADPSQQELLKGLQGATLRWETEEAFAATLSRYERLRILGSPVPAALLEAAALADRHIARGLPLACGRLELLHYIREQSVSFEYHRYGTIIDEPSAG